jgi:putative membrane protein
MRQAASVLVGMVAVIHLAIMAVEMFPTEHPYLLAQLEDKLGFAEGQGVHASPIVRNAGLFNGFLATGLFWGMRTRMATFQIRAFFLSCVMIAGLFGAMTLPNPMTLAIQTLPAAIALLVNWLALPKGLAGPPE